MLSTYHPLINVRLAISMQGVSSDDDCAIVYRHMRERRAEMQQGQLRTKLVVRLVLPREIMVPLRALTALGVNVPAIGSYLT